MYLVTMETNITMYCQPIFSSWNSLLIVDIDHCVIGWFNINHGSSHDIALFAMFELSFHCNVLECFLLSGSWHRC